MLDTLSARHGEVNHFMALARVGCSKPGRPLYMMNTMDGLLKDNQKQI